MQDISLSHRSSNTQCDVAETLVTFCDLPVPAYGMSFYVIYSHASASLQLLSCPPFGGAGSVTSTWAGFYAWCWTNNWLHEVLPISAFRDSETARTEGHV